MWPQLPQSLYALSLCPSVPVLPDFPTDRDPILPHDAPKEGIVKAFVNLCLELMHPWGQESEVKGQEHWGLYLVTLPFMWLLIAPVPSPTWFPGSWLEAQTVKLNSAGVFMHVAS